MHYNLDELYLLTETVLHMILSLISYKNFEMINPVYFCLKVNGTLDFCSHQVNFHDICINQRHTSK